MREFIKNMNNKENERMVPTTLDYRIKQGISERPAIDPQES